MLLGEWWVANPTNAADAYEPPDPADRVPGALREVAHGRFALETIGFLGDRPFMAGGPAASVDRARREIWGTGRDSTCYSLLDSLRSNTMWSPVHVSDGHEDWQVGWLAKGRNVWVTSDEECNSARIEIDDLRAWALHGRPDNVEFDDDRHAVTIDFRDETLGSKTIGDTSVSLVRDPKATLGSPDRDPERHFSFANVVYWEVEGPVTLRAIVTDWIGHFESFARFMTMEPSVVSSIKCSFSKEDGLEPGVELIAPRLARADGATDRDAEQPSPHKYLTTVCTIQEFGIDPMDVFASYWREVAAGDVYMAMELHLESQDRLLSRGSDSALLNAVRSVESLYAAQNPRVAVESISVQDKVGDAVSRAGDIGSQILEAWPELDRIGELRRDVAHGRSRPSDGFGLRCRGGAMALQWIQRARLLAELGFDGPTAQSIVSSNFQYRQDLRNLQNWSNELGSQPAP